MKICLVYNEKQRIYSVGHPQLPLWYHMAVSSTFLETIEQSGEFFPNCFFVGKIPKKRKILIFQI